eukprot:1472010-Amphidinium_carterae.1
MDTSRWHCVRSAVQCGGSNAAPAAAQQLKRTQQSSRPCCRINRGRVPTIECRVHHWHVSIACYSLLAALELRVLGLGSCIRVTFLCFKRGTVLGRKGLNLLNVLKLMCLAALLRHIECDPCASQSCAT